MSIPPAPCAFETSLTRHERGTTHPNAFTTIPLWRRILWGLLAREGLRVGEALDLTWSCLDLKIGTLTLDENKTDDARSWPLNKGVTRALAAWKKLQYPDPDEKPKANARVIVEENGGTVEGKPFAKLLREDLERAGIDRAKLFAKGKNRLPIRAHDLRGTFVTTSLANGKTEAWAPTHRASKLRDDRALPDDRDQCGRVGAGRADAAGRSHPRASPRARRRSHRHRAGGSRARRGRSVSRLSCRCLGGVRSSGATGT